MKQSLYIILILVLCGCFGRQPNITTGMEGKPIPSFNLRLMDSTVFNTQNITSTSPIILFFISPSCPYCKALTEDIISDKNLSDNNQIFIISSAPLQSLKQYYKDFNLQKHPNITVGYDYDDYFSNRFQVNSIPYIAIYDKSKKLKQVLIGKVKTGLIKDIISD